MALALSWTHAVYVMGLVQYTVADALTSPRVIVTVMATNWMPLECAAGLAQLMKMETESVTMWIPAWVSWMPAEIAMAMG
jgi:hypothetical protein